ncbi:MAG: type II toxin-antitoxin system Phd/YefM family antitoxin [Gemmatimonadetes bacterium]|nr:type II toxin-antitoxin system Phd/YefM family antitoxin [Gemmatimonadota bacterium]MYG84713.1 type II toxin-antitoxin system Phd/YefM family antitoxin [Gemmatimonadota bacterium]MYJ88722.1 type II toxin-antitoxin system Phd/YefM family antitoxin [Gemmatimonadota bacterium]
MGREWQVQEAKAKFSELLETSREEGPQVVTKRGVKTAVLVSIETWERMARSTRLGLKDLLLSPEARTESLTPLRERRRTRGTADPSGPANPADPANPPGPANPE